MTTENLDKLIAHFAKITGVSFISFPYENREGEKSRRLVNIGVSYDKAKQKDIAILKEGVKFVESSAYTKADWEIALTELKQSLTKPNENRSNGQTNAYVALTDNGSLKWNIETQSLYIFGTSVKKTVDEAGVYKEVKSSSKTLAKNAIKKSANFHHDKFRTFKVDNLIGNIKMNGDVVEID